MPFYTVVKNATGKIDQVLLTLATLFVLFAPLNKRIWYDETVSILCSKGISHSTPTDFKDASLITGNQLEQYNTTVNVFDATVIDNGNSFLYNIILHFFTNTFGNAIDIYVLLSKLFAVCALISFYFLSRKLLDSPFFRSVAILFLLFDPVFWGMSTEIRAYSAGMFFICLSAIYLFRFIDENDSPANLLLTLIFSVCAVLTHFLSVYVLFGFGLLLIWNKGKHLFAKKYIVAILLPVGLMGVYFLFAYQGLLVMNKQNSAITEIRKDDFTYFSAVLNFIRFTAINLKVLLPAFSPSVIIKFISAAILVFIYIVSRKVTSNITQKKSLNRLLLLALSGSLFLTALSIIAGHNTPFYNRYFSFSIPFNCLFTALFLQLLFQKEGYRIIKFVALAFFTVPVVFIFYKIFNNTNEVKYSHVQMAEMIRKKNMTDVEIKESSDALLIHCFLPGNYSLNYHIVPGATNFKAYNQSSVETLPIILINK